MKVKRSYHQFCPLARSLDLLGDRWTLLLVRELLLGPKRYSDLLEALPGIGTNLLASRLKELTAAGLARRSELPRPAAATVYELTDRGRDLEPAVLELARWGMELLDSPRAGDTFRPGWLLLSLRASFRPHLAAGVHETYELRVGDDVLHVRVDDGDMTAGDGPADAPDVVVRPAPHDFVALGTGAVEAEEAVGQGRVELEGDPAALRRMVALLAPRPA